MAKPIQPTPVLCGREAQTFLKTMTENEGRPAYKIACPNISSAISRVKNDASWNKKQR